MSWTWTELSRRVADFDQLPQGALDADLCDAIAGRHLLLTGATGFVGGWICAAIGWVNARMAAPVRVTAIARTAPVGAPAWLEPMAVDLRNGAAPPVADLVLHAAMSSERAPAGGDDAIRDTAAAGTAWALCAAASARHTLLLSSGAAESGHDVYAEAKRAAEYAATEAQQAGLPVSVARLFSCIGPGYRAHSHLAHVALFEDAMRGGPLRLRGDGTVVRSYLYGADLAAWLLRILVIGRPGTMIDAGSDIPVTLRELAMTIAAAAGLPPDCVTIGAEPPVPGRERYLARRTAMHDQLGLRVWTALPAAARRTLAHLRDGAAA